MHHRREHLPRGVRCQRDVSEELTDPVLYRRWGSTSLCNVCVVHLQDGDNLKDALRYAAALLGELRTGELQPHRYFELYMQVMHSTSS